MNPAESTAPALEFRNVTAGYHGQPVIRGLDVAIGRGEMVGLLGPNGAGKTTLLRCITGLCRPLSGNVRVFGFDVARLSAEERARRVAVVPQELDIPVAFTVQEIVMLGRTASLSRWSRPTPRDRAIAERAMVYTDVVDMKNRPYTELSGGEQQRTIVAMALAQEPQMILLDEATSHLDMNHRLELMQIVERLNTEQGVTVVMISHDLNLAAEFCGRLLLMDRGGLVADGPPARVLTGETLRRVYRCDVLVQENPVTGSLSVVPARRLAPGRSGEGVRVHVVAGGGCGEELLRCLSLCKYTVTCGVLNEGDSDTEVAGALEIPTVCERPFSPIGPAAMDRARALARTADALVVCGVPFGPGNVVNLDLAEQALAAGKPVFLTEGVANRDYTPAREATARAAALDKAGAQSWSSIADLLTRLPHRPPPAAGMSTAPGGGAS